MYIEPLSIWRLRDGRIVMIEHIRRTCFDAGGRIKIVKFLVEKTNDFAEDYLDHFLWHAKLIE
jgi:hypothetical protein